MIARPAPSSQPPDWRRELKEAFRRPSELLSWLDIDPASIEGLEDPGFPMLVPRDFAARMRPGDPDDPLLRQVLPLARETGTTEGFVDDPVGDGQALKSRGLLHKYTGRVLVVTTGACAIHCRYCFRQAFPYSSQHANRQQWAGVVSYLADHPDVSEVILSGGDPLMLDTFRLRNLTNELGRLSSIRRLRIHTRQPVVLPSRINDSLTEWLSDLPWPVTIVVHANHAREFDTTVGQAVSRLRSTGAHLLNQAVLLRRINDSLEALAELMSTGFDHGVLPYYLHLLDRVAGSAHHEVGEKQARELVTGLRERLPGYLVPRLVREEAGKLYKTPLL